MTFKEICENAGIETRSYSGRGMFGRKCLGIDTRDLLDTIADLIDAEAEQGEANVIADALRNAKTDSMGLGMILYFPDIAWHDKDDEVSEQGIRDDRSE